MERAKMIRLFILVLIISLGALIWTFSGFKNDFQLGIGLLMAILTGLWLISLVIKDASIIDVFWGSGFVIIAWFYAFQNDLANMGFREMILLSMITIWGMRLTIYLAMRNLGKGEDYRYAQWRKDNGEKWWWLSFFRVFALQGFLLWIISATYLPSLSTRAEMGVLEYFGVLLWIIGLFFESVGDYQLAQFKKDYNNKGKVLNTGVWRYTRHPNYFGDATIWWGFFFFAFAHPQGWMFVFCPIVMTFFLLKVSGVAMLEVKLKESKPQYLEYIRTTSSFIPMVPKK